MRFSEDGAEGAREKERDRGWGRKIDGEGEVETQGRRGGRREEWDGLKFNIEASDTYSDLPTCRPLTVSR